jgi:hypothetical protein
MLWDGVVMLERVDPLKAPHTPFGGPVVRVMSARSLALDGRRAIAETVPYAQVKHYFRSKDGDHVFVRAELREDGHLQLGELCTRREWADTAHVGPSLHH